MMRPSATAVASILLAASSEAFTGTAATRRVGAHRHLSVTMESRSPSDRWESYKATVASARAFEEDRSVASALPLCRLSATNRDVDPETVCDALIALEKGQREAAKSDGGALSRQTLEALDGAWRLVFTTGTAGAAAREANRGPLPRSHRKTTHGPFESLRG